MTSLSPLSSRRFTVRKTQATQQLIVFHICNQGFALPIRVAYKVIPMGEIYGAPQGAGLGLTLYQNQELLVIDAENRIFKRVPSQDLSLSAGSDGGHLYQHGAHQQGMVDNGSLALATSGTSELSKGAEVSGDYADLSQLMLPPCAPEQYKNDNVKHYILILQNSQGKRAGLPLNSPPALQRVPFSAFAPLKSDYISEGNIRCVSALVMQENDQPPLFLLNPDQLVPSPNGVLIWEHVTFACRSEFDVS